MTKKYSTKRALIASILVLCMCFSMLIGTTFAWFTDSVTSSSNVIQTGKLDVAMYWAEGDEDPAAVSDWKVADGAIFNHDKWEPGYSEAKHIKIANEGTLALKYQMRILANGVVSELADVIDVYYFDAAKQLSRADFVDANKLGTLTEVLNVTYEKNISKTIAGSLEAGTTKTVTLAFKMQEDAGNEYQNLSIGSDFSIQLLATQYTSESDSFDPNYDADAGFAPQEVPAAMVYALSQSKLQTITIGGFDGATLDTGYSFQPTETYEQASESEYEWAHADFFVYADATVPANSMALAGYYTAFDGFSWGGETCTSTNWIGLSADTDIAAGAENGIRLLGDGMGLPGISYSEICNYGNDGTGFLCGATDLTGANEGTTLYVELRVYKVGACGNTSESHHHSSFECETGEYITIGKFQYTFGGSYTTLDDGSEVFMADDGDIVLVNTENVTATEYYVPDGVTSIGNYAFTYNSTIETVVVSDDVTSLGRAFDANSSIKKVVLNEGLETIDSRAFKETTALEEVLISSTVTTIADNAFQKSGIKTITIPATVETIGETAFGASMIETVIFEGNTSVQGYAFRGCKYLRTVYFNGDDNTFIPSTLNGRNSIWFCNGESNNPNTSDITFYVQNATVAARVYAAMGAEAGNTTVIVANENGETVSETVYAKDAAALSTALNQGTGTIVLGAGEMKMPSSSTNAEISIVGTKDTVLDVTKGAYMDSATVTIEGVTIKTSTGYVVDANGKQGSDYAALYTPNVTYINCTFEGPMRIGRDGAKFIDCTFNSLGNDYIWTYGNDVTFEGCTFNTEGKAILIYSDGGNEVSKVTVKNCVFNSTKGATAGAIKNQNCAAIEIHNYGNGVDLVTSDNTYDANFSGEWRIKTYETGKTQVVVNGVEYTDEALDGKILNVVNSEVQP